MFVVFVVFEEGSVVHSHSDVEMKKGMFTIRVTLKIKEEKLPLNHIKFNTFYDIHLCNYVNLKHYLTKKYQCKSHNDSPQKE